ncbi:MULTISPECIES: CRISPR-associated endonuclease Cas2 [Nostocales]|jgi:CRISPR-associated protein Cas2|uniref:CRISPR-associated endonuclease Cas2 n=1 Tax=Dolichospermum flos-aquae UHCC 0037 TaxID=2590026 RepID=A0ACC7S8M2_DOLFA|nr:MULTISPECIES: CRISPR-associated endonuclease Cas2 [Nostocales]MBO1071875.1 CRISPR-associated endonuclease Cas2 [Dolichospermum sp. DEX189]QSV69851.1 MAG: CRISPR-associated endonuclease Cas2 [Aphanizomenon flos-aquae KM1D3_PB]ALB39672.1 CRISPR-associated protein Cas2 [Anabaena sp. WA102]KHG40306.1 CRISPR-associated protein Cas2 [Aphanizomenon flos-aquae 2012/KM1/D3]MBO1065204.1 CRISPR-associated endonuclease Cas2 [Anabaena sp. 54]
MLLYVIVYDITCDKRRKKVSDLLEGYGQRVQYSVFECILNQTKYSELQKRLRKQIKSSEDSIRFYPLSKHTFNQIETWGEPPVTELPGSTII